MVLAMRCIIHAHNCVWVKTHLKVVCNFTWSHKMSSAGPLRMFADSWLDGGTSYVCNNTIVDNSSKTISYHATEAHLCFCKYTIASRAWVLNGTESAIGTHILTEYVELTVGLNLIFNVRCPKVVTYIHSVTYMYIHTHTYTKIYTLYIDFGALMTPGHLTLLLCKLYIYVPEHSRVYKQGLILSFSHIYLC